MKLEYHMDSKGDWIKSDCILRRDCTYTRVRKVIKDGYTYQLILENRSELGMANQVYLGK